jgi:hypothetical protein
MKISEFLSPGYEQHSKLNPLLWDENDHIRPEIKEKLLKIAKHFRDFVEIDFPILDIVITGGMTGRYYTKHSDIDLHLITDFSKIDCDQEVAELFDTKRLLYKERFDIEIKQIPVELYIEDVKQPAVGGAYSIVKSDWITASTEPKNTIDQTSIEKTATTIAKLISKAIKTNDLQSLEKLKKSIWEYRKQGLAQQGEFGTANLAFKTLRNSGLLAKLVDKIRELQSAQLGMKQ